MNKVSSQKAHFCFVMPFHIREGRGGGAEVQAWLLARELARRGNTVSYVAQSVRGKAGKEEILDEVRLRWVRYAHHFRWSNAPAYYRAMAELDPDIVVQRMTNFMTGVVGLYCRRHGKKFVWMCTDNAAPLRWMSWRAQRRTNRSRKVNPVKAAVFLADAFVSDLARQWGMRQVSLAFTQNEFQEEALRRSFGLASRRMISGHEAPARVISPEERLAGGIVLWVANLGPNKRPEKFFQLARMGHGSGLRFVIIGGRQDAVYIENLFKDAPPNLEWLGRRPFTETLAWFDRAAFFVNTSFAEGFPNTFIQAWLRGVPVLTLSADPDGIIAREGLGRVCPDTEAMLGDLLDLATRPEEYDRLSRRVMDFASDRYTVSAVADAFLENVDRLCACEEGQGHRS